MDKDELHQAEAGRRFREELARDDAEAATIQIATGSAARCGHEWPGEARNGGPR